MDVPSREVAGVFDVSKCLRDVRLQRPLTPVRRMGLQPHARLLGNRLSFEQQYAKRVG